MNSFYCEISIVGSAPYPEWDGKEGLFQDFKAAGYAEDSEKAERFWRLSEEIVLEIFEI